MTQIKQTFIEKCPRGGLARREVIEAVGAVSLRNLRICAECGEDEIVIFKYLKVTLKRI